MKDDPLKTINSCFCFLNLDVLETIPEIKKNQTESIRFPRFYHYSRNVINKKNPIRNNIKVFIPNKLKQKLKKKINEIILRLSKSKKGYPKMNLEDRKWLIKLYQKDVDLLKKISSNSFCEWKDFY